jgi:hypothetical protein
MTHRRRWYNSRVRSVSAPQAAGPLPASLRRGRNIWRLRGDGNATPLPQFPRPQLISLFDRDTRSLL